MNKYEAKARYVQNRNIANREQLEGKLTDEQVGALEWLCKVRHDIHTNGVDAIFYTESSNYDDMIKLLDCEIDDTMTEAGFDNFAESAREDISQEIERVNTEIEEFLRGIDRKFGTNYCPTGYARLM